MTTFMDIDRVVHEVVRRLAQMQGAPSQSADAAAPGVSREGIVNADLEPSAVRLSDRVITIRSLSDRALQAKTWLVPYGAIITPAVQDIMRERKIAKQYASAEECSRVVLSSGENVPVRIRLLIASSSSRLPARAVAPTPINGTIDIVHVEHLHLDACIAEVTNSLLSSAAAAAAAAYSATSSVSSLAGPIGSLAVVITDQPAIVLCKANRQTHVRAAWAVDLASVISAVQDLDANLLVIDVIRSPIVAARNLVRRFITEPRRPGIRPESAQLSSGPTSTGSIRGN